MSKISQFNDYDTLIVRIQRKRKIITVLTIIILLITILACSPSRTQILDTVIDYKGVHPVITALIVLAILFFALLAYSFVSSPLITSMDIECDPKKHLMLNDVLNTEKNLDHIYAVDYIYLGRFQEALDYSNKMIAINKPNRLLEGLFNKARCEFFLGDFDSLKATVMQYENTLNNMNKLNRRSKDAYKKIQKCMDLLVAIADEDEEKITALSDLEPWYNSKATQGYVYYLKGVAAYILKDKNEAVYRFMYLKENCDKTVLPQLAEQYLLDLNNGV